MRKLNAKMTPPWMLSISRAAKKIDCISKYFLMEKMAFMAIPNICFHEAQISERQFFCHFPINFFDFFNNILNMKKYDVLDLSTIQNISETTIRTNFYQRKFTRKKAAGRVLLLGKVHELSKQFQKFPVK